MNIVPRRRGVGKPGFPTPPPAGGFGGTTPSGGGMGKPGFPILSPRGRAPSPEQPMFMPSVCGGAVWTTDQQARPPHRRRFLAPGGGGDGGSPGYPGRGTSVERHGPAPLTSLPGGDQVIPVNDRLSHHGCQAGDFPYVFTFLPGTRAACPRRRDAGGTPALPRAGVTPGVNTYAFPSCPGSARRATASAKLGVPA